MDKYSIITEHRGVGLIQGLEFTIPVNKIIAKAMDMGLILISAGTNVIRFLPPLILEEKHVDDMIEILDKCLDEVEV